MKGAAMELLTLLSLALVGLLTATCALAMRGNEGWGRDGWSLLGMALLLGLLGTLGMLGLLG
jgi:hypothetical protein